jgi:hypothetical protein
MQHHGAPTRLLDWTFSEYVALFFAIDGAREDAQCAVWAVNQTRCWNRFKDALPPFLQKAIEVNDKDSSYLNHVLHEGLSKPAICPLNPFRLNERLAIQRGTFLVPSDPDLPFQDVFDQFIGFDDCSVKKIEILCTREFLVQAFTELHRMNVSNVTLFPGVDGLARSLNTCVRLRHLRPQN